MSDNKQQEEVCRFCKGTGKWQGIANAHWTTELCVICKGTGKTPQQSNPTNTEEQKKRPVVQNPKDYAIKLAQKEVPSYGAQQSQSVNTEEQLKWKDAVLNPPKESGRYWCYVTEYNDLGISHYQWNCAYSAEENRWSDNGLAAGDKVTHWMPLAEQPKVRQSDSEQIKSLEKEAEEKYPYPEGYHPNATNLIVIQQARREGYIAGAQRTEQLLKEKEQWIWDAAITLANNICVQISDRYNNDDQIEEADVANECAKAIRDEIGKINVYLKGDYNPTWL